MGRLVIPLYLLNKGVISKPCFYISDYFERNRELYYGELDRPRKGNDLSHWVKFFLAAVTDTAKSAKIKFGIAVNTVNKLNEQAIGIKGRTENVRIILNAFYLEPLLGIKEICEKTNLPQATVSVIVNHMQKSEILTETTGFSRNKVFMLESYVDAFKINE